MAPVGPRIAILTGVTASGKTALALELASRVPGLEIVNADSMLVYRGMDIGTAKPTREEMARVPHHLVDIRDPDEPFTAADFRREAERAIAEIHARGERALVVGGTGFYLKALLYGVWEAPPADPVIRARLETLSSPELRARLAAKDPASAERIGESDRYRLIRALEIIEQSGRTPTELEAERPSKADPRFELFVIDRAAQDLALRISERTQTMLDQGLVEETRRILERYPECRALGAVGYAETRDHLKGIPPEGRIPRPGIPGLRDEIELATRQLVKRQRTWFRGQHPEARWFELDRERAAIEAALTEVYS